MVKEIWKMTEGHCKENSISRKRVSEGKGKDKIKDGRGAYIPIPMAKSMYNRLIKNTIPGMITGISVPNNGNKYYAHVGINIDNDDGKLPNKSIYGNDENIDNNSYKCYSPIKWQEYNTGCNGELISENIISNKMKNPMEFNKVDNKCRMECLKDKNCKSYELTIDNCKLYSGTIDPKSPPDSNGSNTYCVVKPYIYDYENIDKKYLDKLRESDKDLDMINSEANEAKDKLTDIFNEYTAGSKRYINKRIMVNKKDFENTRDLGKKYFNTLFNFHKDDIDTINRDSATINATNGVYITDTDRINKNKTKLADLNTNLYTVNRQNSILYQSLLKHNGVELTFKLLTGYFIIIIILLILKNKNIINDTNIVSYIIFVITIILLGVIFFRIINSKNRSLYNYQNKVFKVVKK